MADDQRAALFRIDDPARSTKTLIEMSVAINRIIFEVSGKNDRMVYRDPWPKGDTLTNILRVAERDDRRFASIVRRFPHTWPIHEQGAYILRAYSGLQIFPDANHRTGLAISRLHLRLHGHVLFARLDEWKQLVATLKDQHSPYASRCKADGIDNRNRCFQRVADFYRDHCRRRGVLDLVRERVARRTSPIGELAFWDEEPEAEAARKRAQLAEDPTRHSEGP